MKTLNQHLEAMAELETASQYADYLFWQSHTPEMQKALLEYVPSHMRGTVWSGVMARHHEQRTGQPRKRKANDT